MTNYQADGTPIHKAEDGTLRKSRYGAGRQPWDDIKDAGWGPAFAAGNVLKNLRRSKEPEHSLESAKWYWARLNEEAAKEPWGVHAPHPWRDALVDLRGILHQGELYKIEGGR